MDHSTYAFIHLPEKECKSLAAKETQEYLMKWSMKGNLKVQYYSFNQPFHIHKKDKFVYDFFTDSVVYSTLIYNQTPIGTPASSITTASVPCTILSMEFFDRLLDPENGIVRNDGKSIIQCQEDDEGGFIIDDNLRNTILKKGSKYFSLFNESDRKQFLWRIFCHLCLGGEWCQYEFNIEPYLTTTKNIYKDIISVERVGDSTDLVIRSIVLRVQAYDENKKPLIPTQPINPQNFVYLIIDPFKRSVTVFTHCYGQSCYD